MEKEFMEKILRGYYYSVCMFAFFASDIEEFFDSLDLPDFYYDHCCYQLQSILDTCIEYHFDLDEDMKKNLVDFIILLTSKLKKDSVSIHHNLLGSLNSLHVHNMSFTNPDQLIELLDFYNSTLQDHGVFTSREKIYSITEQGLLMHLKIECTYLLYKDYVIFNQLLKEPRYRDFNKIDSIGYKNNLFLVRNLVDGIDNLYDFQQLVLYLESLDQDSIKPGFFNQVKAKILSFIKKGPKK